VLSSVIYTKGNLAALQLELESCSIGYLRFSE
jgi:hypothetical protein